MSGQSPRVQASIQDPLPMLDGTMGLRSPAGRELSARQLPSRSVIRYSTELQTVGSIIYVHLCPPVMRPAVLCLSPC
eukprot:scaffold584557_cov19-Prasinocladus_malaysianus.AAC.1